jgi:hypothetical protein
MLIALSFHLSAQEHPVVADGCGGIMVKVGMESPQSKKSWIRRHPILSSALGIGATVVATTAPIMPGNGYMGSSLALDWYQKSFDSVSYRGDSNAQQIEVLRTQLARQLSGDPLVQKAGKERLSRDELLRFFQPVLFQDMTTEGRANPAQATRLGETLAAQDMPMSPLAFSRADARSNYPALQAVAQSPEALEKIPAEIFGYATETDTHYYFTYPVYYAANHFEHAKTSGLQDKVPVFPHPTKMNHDHDIEIVVVVARKEAHGFLPTPEMVLTFRHGMIHVHSPDSQLQNHARNRLGTNLSGKDKQNMLFGPFYQPNAIHHDRGSISFLTSPEGHTMGPLIFSSRMGHATYPASLDAWKNGHGSGVIYMPEFGSFKWDNFDPQSKEARAGLAPLRLINFEKFLDQHGSNPKVFTGTQEAFEMPTSRGDIRTRSDLPQSFAPPGGAKVSTNLPGGSRGRTPYPLAMPHAVHQFLLEGWNDSGPISDVYQHNYFIEGPQ